MTDIVELAIERRETLTAEMARLDEFIQMAEALMDSGEGGADADDGDPDELAEPDLESLDYDLLLTGDLLLLSEIPPEEEPEPDEDELLLTDAVTEAETDPDSELDAHVGMRIRHRRWMMGIDQEELAKLAGITVGQVQRFEAGDSRVNAKQMRGIAEAMKVPMAFFLEGLTDNAPQPDPAQDNMLPDK